MWYRRLWMFPRGAYLLKILRILWVLSPCSLSWPYHWWSFCSDLMEKICEPFAAGHFSILGANNAFAPIIKFRGELHHSIHNWRARFQKMKPFVFNTFAFRIKTDFGSRVWNLDMKRLYYLKRNMHYRYDICLKDAFCIRCILYHRAKFCPLTFPSHPPSNVRK